MDYMREYEKWLASPVARPHPVVRIGSELADGRGRSTYHADIAVGCL